MRELEDHFKSYFNRPMEERIEQIRIFLNNNPSPHAKKHEIGICAHIGAGKTTVTDRYLYLLSKRDFKPF
jgi:hypothetical protein